MRGQLRIDEMFAFICLDDDETEGIPAFIGPDGMAIPLCGADIERAASLRPIAEMMAKEYKKKITLVKFSHREEMEVIDP